MNVVNSPQAILSLMLHYSQFFFGVARDCELRIKVICIVQNADKSHTHTRAYIICPALAYKYNLLVGP